MAIAKLKLFNISSDTKNIDPILARLVEIDFIHLVPASEIVDRVHGLQSYSTDNPCNIILKEILDIEKNYDVKIPEKEVCSLDYSLENMRDYIHTTHEKINQLTNHKKDTLELIKKYQDALTQVNNIANLNISLDDLFSCDYINVRVGRIPLDSVEKLNFYSSKPFVFQTFHVDKGSAWCLYLTTPNNEREIDNIFSSLFFDRVNIPEFVHGTPISAQATLKMEIEVAEKSLREIEEDIQKVLEESMDKLIEVKNELTFLAKLYEAKKYVVGLGNKININGFVEIDNLKKLEDVFIDMSNVEIEVRPPDYDKRLTPPTKLKNNWFTRPFGMFVEMYGVPSYQDMDPTPIVAITYSLLFGIMFGDLGQGLLLILIGFLMYKLKGMRLGEVGMRIGLSSAFFGFLYGSVFGNEELLTPILENIFGIQGKPIHVMDSDFTMTLLIATVGLGSIFIVTAMILNIITSLKRKHYAEAFFSHNGFAGLTFYGFVLVTIVLTFTGIANLLTPLFIIPFAVLPILIIMFKEPLERLMHGHKMFPTGIGGFLTEAFFEAFEVVLSYITNTMSFLRVGGFVLSHAGMMLVVFTLMEMMDGVFGQGLTFVLGNLFVMGLEGLIVGIQVLRLEFYEMFSRYFEGNGIPFKYNVN
ncbi:MAG: V-type ATPase 116kDa subunit family protein [Candidatus Izemoplasmatales bacterium]|jgi:V/A-type H+-transporting ATPase subunit I|nr:V-type ATPase 116kDa subunit family protein [Candidatus Izemoplasmatales bacterium]